MSRVDKNIRKAVKTATQYPATIVDTHGGTASARLSGNGAIVHNLQIIGGPVDIGDKVSVDYTTPEPTVVATSRAWLTMDDLNRELAKIKQPEASEALSEIDKFIAGDKEDIAAWKWIATGHERGLLDAAYHLWDLFPDTDLWPNNLFIRWPNARIGDPRDEHMDEWYDGGVIGSWIGENPRSCILNNAWAMQASGTRMENLSIITSSTYSWTTVYNFWLWNEAGPTYIREDGNTDAIYRNCHFEANPYMEVPYSMSEGEANGAIPFANFWIADSASDGDKFNYYFYDCTFYSRVGPSSTLNPHAIYFSGGAGSEDVYVYLYNCTIDCGPQPFSNEDWGIMDEGYGGNEGKLHVYAYNCRFIGGDPANMDCLTIMEEGDRASILHTHTSGSSGGYDDMAVHMSVSGEW